MMIPFLIALGWLGIATGLLLATLSARRFCTFERLQPSRDPTEWEVPSLTVIVPARNESSNIERCLGGLLAQTYPSQRMKILIVDDNSTDDTAARVRRAAESDPRVKLIEAGPLPKNGWIGKSHACWQGVKVTNSEWVCFVDADTVAAPALLTTAVAFAQANGIDLLSLLPCMELGSIWERLILPSGLLGYELAMGARRINDPATRDAVACGQFILIRRRVYDSVEGHAAVRSEIIEDVMLARIVKRAGNRVYLMRGDDLIRVRMYTNLREIWEGMSKNAVESVGNIPAAMITAIGALLLAWAPLTLPLWTWANMGGGSTVGLDQLTFGLALIGSVITISSYVLTTRAFPISGWYGLLLPLGLTMAATIVLDSVWRRVTGQRAWRGRMYSSLGATAASAEGHLLRANNQRRERMSAAPGGPSPAEGYAHPAISIIVPALNEEKLIERTLLCFPSEVRARYNIELIVSDGGSTDRTLDIARSHADIIVKHTGHHRQTIAEGRNRGAEQASGDLFVFINADTVPANPEIFVTELARLATKTSVNCGSVAVACPVEIAPEERRLSDRLFHTYFNSSIRVMNRLGIGVGRGECQIVWSDAFLAVGGYSNHMVACEDFDLYKRLAKYGTIGYRPDLLVYESPRRYRRHGYVRTILNWQLNGLATRFLGRSVSKEWEQVR